MGWGEREIEGLRITIQNQCRARASVRIKVTRVKIKGLGEWGWVSGGVVRVITCS